MALPAEQLKAITQRMYDEANVGNVDIFAELLAPDFLSIGGAGFKDRQGPEGFATLYRTFLEALPDLTFRVEDLIAENDLVLARGTLGGTHKGNFMGMAPPTGKYVSWTGSAFFRFNDDGLADRRWQDYDGVGLMQQLGVVPGPYVPRPPAPQPPTNPGPATSPAQAREILARFIEEVWNEGKPEFVDELFHPEATSPSAPDLPPGPTGVKQILTMIRTGFPDFHMRIERLVAEDDKIGAQFVQGGTHEGDFMGIPPTGRTVEWTETGILRFEGGKVVESWYESDFLSLMQQLGVGDETGAASG
jgi:steroid delta-isomerase-like uncharacterized protein